MIKGGKKIKFNRVNSKIFKEYDIRGAYPSEISEQTAYALGLAFTKIIKAKKIVVGRNARSESEKVFWPLVAGLYKGGLKISDLGVCATPELFFAVGAKKFPCGVMVTASHSPAGQTGFKFCDGRGRVFGKNTGLKKLERVANHLYAKHGTWNMEQKQEKIDFTSVARDYKKFALSFVGPAEVRGFKIILDASSGSGARLGDVIFHALPLDVVYMNFRANDKYPDHCLNPLLKTNQQDMVRELRKRSADLGIIFDGDADRAIFFDEKGNFIEPYYINCLMSQIILRLKKGITIVADARLGLLIADTIKKNGGKAYIQRSGYANFITTMDDKKLLFGCENSGHFILNFALKPGGRQYVYGDAIIPILLILKYLRQNKLKLSQAIKPFTETYKISGELNFSDIDFVRLEPKIKKYFSGAKFSKVDGLSVFGPSKKWFFNVRPSQTEPLTRVNIEAKDDKLLRQIKEEIISLIR